MDPCFCISFRGRFVSIQLSKLGTWTQKPKAESRKPRVGSWRRWTSGDVKSCWLQYLWGGSHGRERWTIPSTVVLIFLNIISHIVRTIYTPPASTLDLGVLAPCTMHHASCTMHHALRVMRGWQVLLLLSFHCYTEGTHLRSDLL